MNKKLTDTPLVSFVLFTYNQEKFIAEAVKGALQQDYKSIEIIISDDHSTDATFDIISEIVDQYKGPNNIILNRNTHNLGLVPHLNKIISEFVKGEIIILAAGDDISYQYRTKETVQCFGENENAYAVSFPLEIIDENGVVGVQQEYSEKMVLSMDKKYFLSTSFMIGGGSLAFRKEIIDRFGLLNNDSPTEDSTFRLRALLLGNIIREKKPCMKYRIHSNNISSADNIYNLKTNLIIKQYLDDILKAYTNKTITKQLKEMLCLKVKDYGKIRNMQEQLKNTNNLLLKCCRRGQLGTYLIYRRIFLRYHYLIRVTGFTSRG